jgi:hypothetical protein
MLAGVALNQALWGAALARAIARGGGGATEPFSDIRSTSLLSVPHRHQKRLAC